MKRIIIIMFFVFGMQLSALDNSDTVEVRKNPRTDFELLTKSPTGAIVRSLVIPGWGQVYVENYWKAPIVFGGFVGVGYVVYWNHDNYKSAIDEIDAYSGDDEFELENLKNKRDFYRDQRDLSGLYLMGVYVIATVDAYVGAHLFDHNVNDNLSFSLSPNRFGSVCFSISYNF